MNWFRRLASREQLLVAIAAALIALFASWQFILRPVIFSAQQAERELTTAKRNHMIVTAGLPKIALQNSGAQKAGFNRSAVIESARAANVSISRMQPAADDSLQVWLDDSPTLNVYSFLSELDQRYTASTVKAQITRRDDGTVAAQFTFEPR